MENQRRVVCAENEELALYMWRKKQEMAEQPKGLSENNEMTLYKAYLRVCNAKMPIKTLKELSQIKGVGKWTMKLMQGFFETDSGSSEPEDLTKKGKKAKGNRRYVPQKNSVAYALLICLYRLTTNGDEFMRKQELIDAAEASGLSRVPIMPEKGKGKPAQLGSSPRDWYSGWSCMKTLVTKGLVVKSSCPAKYMLTQEGKEAARECLKRSGMEDCMETLANAEGFCDTGADKVSNIDCSVMDKDFTLPSFSVCSRKKSVDVPLESLERFTRMGYSREQVDRVFAEVSETSQNTEVSSLWLEVLCRLREDEVYGFPLEDQDFRKDCLAKSTTYTSISGQADLVRSEHIQIDSACNVDDVPKLYSAGSAKSSFTLRACSSSDYPVQNSSDGSEGCRNVLSMPPLSFGERFEEAYEVVLILDDREQFATQGSQSRKIIENIRSQFKIKIEVRRLPVGDAIWIARHKHLESEYVLDFIVERKKIDDLRSSIRDNRYKDQKLRLLRCGLKKLIYVVEGDPNSSEAAESIKTACFTTEILEGFDLQRTSGLGDTLRKYGYLTQAITQCYQSQLPENKSKFTGVCHHYDGFLKRCQDLDKMTVSDVFAIQLMQAPQVTEEVAIAVLDLYPTLLSLSRAYSLLDGDVCAQEEMLRKQITVVSAVASRNIFQLVWGD